MLSGAIRQNISSVFAVDYILNIETHCINTKSIISTKHIQCEGSNVIIIVPMNSQSVVSTIAFECRVVAISSEFEMNIVYKL